MGISGAYVGDNLKRCSGGKHHMKLRALVQIGGSHRVQWSFGELRTSGEQAEQHGGVIFRTAFRPRGDHPLRTLVSALQAQLA